MFKFREGACVAIKSDNPALGLTTEDTGTIWALYDTEPPAYEVTFSPANGDEFDALMYEEELMELEVEREPGAERELVSHRPGRSLASA